MALCSAFVGYQSKAPALQLESVEQRLRLRDKAFGVAIILLEQDPNFGIDDFTLTLVVRGLLRCEDSDFTISAKTFDMKAAKPWDRTLSVYLRIMFFDI